MSNQSDCREREEDIALLVLDDLGTSAANELREHMVTCEICQRLHDDLASQETRLLSAFHAVEQRLEHCAPTLIRKSGHHRNRETDKAASIGDTIMRTYRSIGRPGKIAASLVMACGGILACLWALSAPHSLYAEAIQAIRNARTIHVVGLNPQVAPMAKTYEIWYEEGVGVKETAWRNGKEEARIDNGQYQWRYSVGSDPAIRTPSQDPMGVVVEILNPNDLLKKVERDIAGDQVIDGFRCELYVGSYPNDPDGSRLMVWVDDQKRVRRFEEKDLRDGKWETVELMKVEYDVPVDRSLFTLDFGDNVEVVGEQPIALEQVCSLEDALVTKEVMGLVFAVHELRRCENGLVYVVASLRPSEVTVRELGSAVSGEGDTHPTYYGDFQLKAPWTREKRDFYEGRWYQPCTVGEVEQGALRIRWSVLIPKGNWLATADQLELGSYVHTRGRLKEKREAAGLKWWGQWNPLVTLTLPEGKSSLTDVLAETHATMAALVGAVQENQLRLFLPRERRDVPDGPAGEKLFTDADVISPFRIPAAEYAEKAHRELEGRRLSADR